MSLLSDERGFSLTELLVTALLGIITLSAIMAVVMGALNASNRVSDRTELVQRGRTVLEQVGQRLRSQVCLNRDTPAMLQADDSTVTFYANLNGSATFQPQIRQLSFANGTLVEKTWANTAVNWQTATPTTSRVITQNLAQVGTTPYLRYYSFTGTSPITPSALLPAPLTPTDLGRAVQVAVSFRALPSSRNAPPANIEETTFQSYFFVRTADPTDPEHAPQCF